LVAQSRGDLEEAEQYYERSLALQQEIGDRSGEAKSLNNLGLVAQSRGDLEEAEQYHERSLAIAEQLENEPLLLDVLGDLVKIYERNGNHSDSVDTCERALSLIEKSDREQVTDRHREFERRYARLSGRDPHETTGRLVYYAFQEQTDGNSLAAARLFGEAWDRRHDLDDDSDAFEWALDGGVGWAAHARLVEETDDPDAVFDRLDDHVDSDPSVEDTLATIEPHADRLAIPPATVYEHLADGSTDTDPQQLSQLADIAVAGADGDKEPFAAAKGRAFAALLANLQTVDPE
jgi:hypothetical protein